jgi:hypothetical protein
VGINAQALKSLKRTAILATVLLRRHLRSHMSRRPATITQADIARAIRAAKQAGANEIEVRVGDRDAIIIRLSSTETKAHDLEQSEDIVL